MKKPKQSTMATLFKGIAKSLKLSKEDSKAVALKNTFVNARLLIDALSQFYISVDHHYETSYSGQLIVSSVGAQSKTSLTDQSLTGIADVLYALASLTNLFDKNNVAVHTFGDEVELVNASGNYVNFVSYVSIDLDVYTAPMRKYEYVIYENPEVEGYFNIGIFVSRSETGSKEKTIIPVEIIFGKMLDLELGDLADFINVLSPYAGTLKDRAVDTVKLRDLIQVENVYCME